MGKLNIADSSAKTGATERLAPLLKRIAAILLIISLIGGLIFGAYTLSSRFLSPSVPATLTASCSYIGIEYRAIIKNSTITPNVTTAKLCDRLTITNQDPVNRLIAFGIHDRHITYDGITTQQLRSNQSFSVTLVQPGNYIFHDHLDDDVEASFTVTN